MTADKLYKWVKVTTDTLPKEKMDKVPCILKYGDMVYFQFDPANENWTNYWVEHVDMYLAEAQTELKWPIERIKQLVFEDDFRKWKASEGWREHSSYEYWYRLDYPSQWPTPHVKYHSELKEIFQKIWDKQQESI